MKVFEKPAVPLKDYNADRLGLSENASYRAAASGQIPGSFRLGSKWLVTVRVADRHFGFIDHDDKPVAESSTPLPMAAE